jgi:hypothetical protein
MLGARALLAFDRPRWLYRSRGAIPSAQVRFRAPRPVTEADVALCERLTAAYVLAQADAPPASGMWSDEVFRERQRELVSALESRDPATLAERLAAMFVSDFVVGMHHGSLGVAQPRWSKRFSHLYALSKLAALAESLGAARAETPEQGPRGPAFADGLEKLVVDTEAALGAPVGFPDVGAPYGIELGERLITSDSPDHMYAAARVRDAIGLHLPSRKPPLRVVEIGGGYGGTAYWLIKMINPQYTIVDLPVVNVLQGYFLAKALGPSKLSFYGETPGRIMILPTHALSRIESPFDVLVNKDSMPEIAEPALLDYLSWARTACSGIFYSYNQEAAAPVDNTPQNVVREAVSRVGGFRPLRRDYSWLRRGYVEEIYQPSDDYIRP